MRYPLLRNCLILLGLATLVLSSQGQTPDVPVVPKLSPSLVPLTNDTLAEGINIPEGTLDGALGLVEILTGRTVLRPQALQQTPFSLVIKQPVTRAEALLAIETTLAMNNIAIAPLGERFIKVVPLGSARIESPDLIEGSTLGLPPSGRIATKLFTFEFVRVEQFAGKIANLLNPQLGGAMPFEQANAVLVTDSISTLQRIETLVKQLDRPNVSSLEPKFYPLVYAKASELASKMQTILQGPAQQQLGTGTTFNADDRTNQIVLISDPRLHPFFDKLIAKLDVRSDPNTRNEVIALKHAEATEVATLVSSLVSGQNQATSRSESVRRPAGAATVQPAQLVAASNVAQTAASQAGISTSEFSSLVTVLADERSNAVVVSGTVEDIRLIRELVDKIDVLLAQVRVEVVIAEVTLTDSNSSGINAMNLVVQEGKLVGFTAEGVGATLGGVGDTLSGVSGGATDSASVLASGFATFSGYDLTSLIQLGNDNGNRKSKANILSVPAVVTTHNKEARVFVGRDIPTISSFLGDTTGTTGQTTNSSFGRTTLSNREVGITLQVKPLIGANGSVQMEIKQEVSSVVDNVTVDGNEQPIVGKREAESFVTVQSGEIVVLGGLQQATENRTRSRFGPIPFISDLLGGRSKEDVRTDLIFFLRPVVLTNSRTDNVEALKRLNETEIKEETERALRGESIY